MGEMRAGQCEILCDKRMSMKPVEEKIYKAEVRSALALLHGSESDSQQSGTADANSGNAHAPV